MIVPGKFTMGSDEMSRAASRGARRRARETLYRVSGEVVTMGDAVRRTGHTADYLRTRINRLRGKGVALTWAALEPPHAPH